VVKLAISLLGTAAAAVAKKVGNLLFKTGSTVWSKIIQFTKDKCLICLFCFPAGTPVQSERGPKPIQDVRKGERIWARDPATGEWRLAEVAETFRREHVGELVTIRAAGEKIVATPRHPFWVNAGEELEERPPSEEPPCSNTSPLAVSGRWVDAIDLRVGDELACMAPHGVAVESVEVGEAALTVYNFHVREVQSYAVGAAGLWVHNASKCPKKGNKPSLRHGEHGPYKELKTRTARGKFDRDHIPSKAALKAEADRLEREATGLGLTPLEGKAIEEAAQTVALPKGLHKKGRTYGGKNKNLIATDSRNLAQAAHDDIAAYRNILSAGKAAPYEKAFAAFTKKTNADWEAWLKPFVGL
jgi:hypothetical protein